MKNPNQTMQSAQVEQLVKSVKHSLDVELAVHMETVEGMVMHVFTVESNKEDSESVRRAVNQFLFHQCHLNSWPASFAVDTKIAETTREMSGSTS